MIKLMIEVPFVGDDKHEIDPAFAHMASRLGYMRENPRKAWSAKEYKECVKWLAEQYLRRELEKSYE